ncbi:MAG: tetratricopeptide repeat protein [Limisphaerales bacterium]
MDRWTVRLFFVLFGWLAFPFTSPAPLIYRAGEGWTYEKPGETGSIPWQRTQAQDQLAVAQNAFDKKDLGLASKAAHRVLDQWPLSDSAPPAQYLIGRCYEAKKQDEKAFKAYQKVLEKYPKISNYQEILQRQYEIANRFLAGQGFKLWGRVPFFPSMDKTADMYEKLVKNGPYSDVAAKAQMNIGAAREKQKEFPQAVKAYERAADLYSDQKKVSANALFKAAQAYRQQAKTSEYDQNVAAQAIATFTDFITLYPDDPRVPEAQKLIAKIKTEQARGSFKVAQFYEKKKRWDGALIYYNEVLLQDPKSSLATQARQRIGDLKKHAK